MKLAIVIPVFNESKVIKTVINSLPRRLKGIDKISIIAVNDGSTDSSQKEILKTDAVLLNHPINLGTGSATITGFEMAKKLSTDIAVSIDGDGQHDPKDIEKVIEPILEQKADLVIGSRLIKSEGMPKLKKAGNFIFNFISNSSVGVSGLTETFSSRISFLIAFWTISYLSRSSLERTICINDVLID